MNWIEELALKRNAQRSNCYIIETFDPKRIAEFHELVNSERFDELVRTRYVRILEYDLQRGEIVDLKDKAPINTDPMSSPISQITQMLSDAPTLLIIKYVFREEHANMISDMLVTWSHDEELYNHKSTVVVFTSSCLLYTSPSPRDLSTSRMPSSA